MGNIRVMLFCLMTALIASVFAAVPELQVTKTVDGNCSAAQLKDGDTITVHFEGSFDNGTIFNSSFGSDKPVKFLLGDPTQAMKGWHMALQGACVGDDLQVKIPYSLAYGEEGRPPSIPPRTDLNYRIRVLAIEKVALASTGNGTADVYMNATDDGDEDYGYEDGPDGKPSPYDPSSLLFKLQFLAIPVAVILFLLVAYCIYSIEYPDRKIKFYRVGDHETDGGMNRVL
ncbi:FK506-binding protein 2-like [Patiria miniata]|uniref:peptidylprolyl isomerase n=1 Tax=Patiria miniata TaxID=46514 RepID=A0A913ZJR4_PATMI|nr:FK506-binding protein 2-like [Patiria miniata]